jgi:branched-chain amino acid transport system ATP-binding protein
MLLELCGVDVSYGVVPALRGVDLTVGAGEVVALLGANGAGKTTLLRTVSGLVAAGGGKVLLDGASLRGLAVHEVAARGVGHVPEGRRVFARMTVVENLLMGAYRDRRRAREGLDAVYALFPLLSERATQRAGTLSGGEQQMLAIGRALMARPRLLLLDEPSMGLAPLVVAKIFETVGRINADGVAVLLVEQNAASALAVAARGYVLETGRVAAADSARALLADDRVRRAYLGSSPEAEPPPSPQADPAPRQTSPDAR